MVGAGGIDGGKIFVELVPRLERGFSNKLENEMSGPLGRVQGLARKAGLGIGLGLAAAVPVVAAAGVALGETFDSAYDTIRTGTGATGQDLEALKGSFREVAKQVPDDFGKVSTAIADLNTRTGATGPELEALSTKVLTLSRITGEDLEATIRNSTRLFGDWGLAAEAQGPALDYLFRVSQATGIGVTDLEERLVQFGAPLRQLGFDMETSAALLGKFEREGVNTEVVLAGMRKGLAKFARDGRDPAEALEWVTEKIKGAGSAAEANDLAIQVFGAKAGPDMAAAIREGRLELGDFVEQMKTGGDTIEGVASDTDDWREKLGQLRNRIFLAAEPLASKLFDGVNRLVDAAIPWVETIGEKMPGALERLRKIAEPIVDGISQIWKILFDRDFTGGPFAEDSDLVDGLFRFRDFVVEKVIPVARDLLEWLGARWKPILAGVALAFALLTAPVSTVIALLVGAYLKFESFRNIVDAVVAWLIRNVPPAFEAVRSAIETAVRWISTNVVPVLERIVAVAVEKFGDLVAWVQEWWPKISEAIEHTVNAIVDVVSFVVEWIVRYWNQFGDRILANARRIWDLIYRVVKVGIDLVRGIIETVVSLINGDWGAAWDAIKRTFSNVWGSIVDILSNVLGIIREVIGAGLEVVGGIVSAALDGIVDFFAKLPGRLADAAGDVFGWLWEAFRSAVNLIIRGWNALDFEIPGFDPPGPGPKFSGFTLGLPDIPELALGGTIAQRIGSAIVGDAGPELLTLPKGAIVTPLNVAEQIAAAALAGRDAARGGPLVAVDARGMTDPFAVADLTARHVAWRTMQEV